MWYSGRMAGPRAIFKGALTFGGISIPVKMYSGIREEHVDFHLLHDEDKTRLRQQMVCELDDQPVPKEEWIKGFEFEKGRYVPVTGDELDSIAPETNRQIEVKDFVKPQSIDPRYYNRFYYLGPDGNEKQFAALAAALKKTNDIGICQWSMRKKNYLAALTEIDGHPCFLTLNYVHEIIEPSVRQPGDMTFRDKELQMANKLIDMMMDKFTPEEYKNEYQAKVKQLVEAKARGEEIELTKPEKEAPTEDDNLLNALAASVQMKEEKKHG